MQSLVSLDRTCFRPLSCGKQTLCMDGGMAVTWHTGRLYFPSHTPEFIIPACTTPVLHKDECHVSDDGWLQCVGVYLTPGGTAHTGHHCLGSRPCSPGGSADCTWCIFCREPSRYRSWTSLCHTAHRLLHHRLQLEINLTYSEVV